jgi:transcriptional regulator with XRE-family HTH domain
MILLPEALDILLGTAVRDGCEGAPSMASAREYRRRKYWTQQELAQHGKVSITTIRNIEQGRDVRYELRTMRRVAKALGVAVEEIDEFREAIGPGSDRTTPGG